MFKGLLEVIVRPADHGEALLNGYPARKTQRVLGRTPDPVTGRTRPGKPAGHPCRTAIRTGLYEVLCFIAVRGIQNDFMAISKRVLWVSLGLVLLFWNVFVSDRRRS